MASVATRSYSAALRCSISLTVLISNVDWPKGKRPQLRGARAEAVVSSERQAAEMRPAGTISDHKDRMASVRFPTINQKNPHYPQPGTEPRRLMFEDIPRSAPTPKKNGGTAPSKKNPPA
jgi:hypothetical protein